MFYIYIYIYIYTHTHTHTALREKCLPKSPRKKRGFGQYQHKSLSFFGANTLK